MPCYPFSRSRAGQTAIVVVIAGVIVVAAIAAALLWKRPAYRQTTTQVPATTTQEVELPAAPEKVYDLSGTVIAVGDANFTLQTRLRTNKNTLRDAYRDATITVRFDSATSFTKRGAFDPKTGQVPATIAATAQDVKVGSNVDVRSRGENVLAVDSFIAAQVTIKTGATATR